MQTELHTVNAALKTELLKTMKKKSKNEVSEKDISLQFERFQANFFRRIFTLVSTRKTTYLLAIF